MYYTQTQPSIYISMDGDPKRYIYIFIYVDREADTREESDELETLMKTNEEDEGKKRRRERRKKRRERKKEGGKRYEVKEQKERWKASSKKERKRKMRYLAITSHLLLDLTGEDGKEEEEEINRQTTGGVRTRREQGRAQEAREIKIILSTRQGIHRNIHGYLKFTKITVDSLERTVVH